MVFLKCFQFSVVDSFQWSLAKHPSIHECLIQVCLFVAATPNLLSPPLTCRYSVVLSTGYSIQFPVGHYKMHSVTNALLSNVTKTLRNTPYYVQILVHHQTLISTSNPLQKSITNYKNSSNPQHSHTKWVKEYLKNETAFDGEIWNSNITMMKDCCLLDFLLSFT